MSTTILVNLRLRGDTAANWTANNPTPLLDEPCVEQDTKKTKVGDGVTAWNALPYATLPLTSYLLASQLDLDGTMAANSDALVPSQKAVRTYVTAGLSALAASVSAAFQPLSSVLSFLATAASANAAGVKGILALVKGDVGLGNVDNTSDASKPVSTATQAALNLKIDLTQKGALNGVAPLDGSGKIASSYLPAIAITSTWVVASQAAQLALTAQEGDVAIRSDETKSYIHNGGTAGTMADWTWLELLQAVFSVNGFTGVVSITTITGNAGTATALLAGGADRIKLDGIAAGATANQTDAHLKDRANHTGTQLANTISDFSTAVYALFPAGFPKISGDCFFFPVVGRVAPGFAMAANVIRLVPFYLPEAVSISELGVRITTIMAAHNIQMAVYASHPTTGRPTGNALAATGNLSTGTLGAFGVAVVGSPKTIPEGWNWMAVNNSGGTVVCQAPDAATVNGASSVGAASFTALSGATTTVAQGKTYNHTFGTWPDLTGQTFNDLTNVACAALMYKAA